MLMFCPVPNAVLPMPILPVLEQTFVLKQIIACLGNCSRPSRPALYEESARGATLFSLVFFIVVTRLLSLRDSIFLSPAS
jgi:hypothetical protein